jgi:hypothetical protein
MFLISRKVAMYICARVYVSMQNYRALNKKPKKMISNWEIMNCFLHLFLIKYL